MNDTVNTLTDQVPSYDGTALRVQIDAVDNAKALVVLVHGLAEHLGRYDHVVALLNKAGFSCFRYDQRGHGHSEGKDGHFDDAEQFAKDCKAMLDHAKGRFPSLPVFLFGHSMGGFTVALFGTLFPGEVRGILTSGALTRYSKPLLGELPLPLPADTPLPNELGDGVCSDPAVIEAYANDPLVKKTFTAGLINAMYAGVEILRARPEAFTDPVLVMHGAKDGLVSEGDSRQFYGEIASEDKGLRIYEGLFHEILNEPVHAHIVDEMVFWMEARLGK